MRPVRWCSSYNVRIHKCYVATRDSHTQVVIYGKKGHAEVNGLVGQTEGTAIVIEKVQDLGRLDFSRNICLFSQTTKSLDGFREVVAEIRRRIADGVQFEYFDTICRPGGQPFTEHQGVCFQA